MNYPKLRGAIREKFGTQEAFAKALSMHPTTLSAKLSGKTDWARLEIEAVGRLLCLNGDEIHAYFFTP